MRLLQPAMGCVLACGLLLGCDNDSDNPTSAELSPFAKNYLSMKLGSFSSNSMASPNGFSDAANASFNRLSGTANLQSGRLKGDLTSGDTTWYPSPWISCAEVTTTINPDKSTTTSYDYGDGCLEGNDYFRYLMFGKYSYTYRWGSERIGSMYLDEYFGSYQSENYGSEYYWEGDTSRWTSNGSSSYAGVSQYDTISHAYSGYYEHEGNDVSTYNGITYAYSGKGRSSYNTEGSTVESGAYSYSSEDYSYATVVLSPLKTSNQCYSYAADRGQQDIAYCFMPVYVSGRERVTYDDAEKSGSFEIDYGDGECDSKVTIIENGNRTEVNLYDYYNF